MSLASEAKATATGESKTLSRAQFEKDAIGEDDEEEDEDELNEDQKWALYQININKPRLKCVDVAPEVFRISKLRQVKRDVRMSHIQNILMKASHVKTSTDPGRYKNPNEFYTVPPELVHAHVKHISEFDKSEAIIPHGEVSKRLYNDILGQRKFDLYGGRFKPDPLTDEEQQKVDNAARKMGLGYTQLEEIKKQQEETVGVVRHIDVFGRQGLDEMKRPPLQTQAHNLQKVETVWAPVGLANNPSDGGASFKSEGNEKYYSYDGEWLKGQMHGYGKYLYDDGGTYEGEFRRNWPHGEGTSRYKSHVVDKYAHKHPKVNVLMLKDMFNLLDRSGDGYINTREFSLCMGILNPKLSSEEAIKKAKEEIVDADINKDGKIDFREFLVQAPVLHDTTLISEAIKILTEHLESADEGKEEEEEDEKKSEDSDKEEKMEEKEEVAVDTHVYQGMWKEGRFSGLGVQKTKSGHYYKGEFNFGKREGEGRIQYKSGLYYEGPMKGGKPHGRGVMESTLTGYRYEGDFVHGSIEGSGTLITPPPESKRVVRWWKKHPYPVLLPHAVREWHKEDDEELVAAKMRDNFINGPRRAAALKDYISAVREDIATERDRVKKARAREAQEKMRQKMIQLKEAKLRALTGEDADGDAM